MLRTVTSSTASTNALLTLDSRLVEAAKSIKVLSSLAWPKQIGEKFLSEWKDGNPTLPQVSYQPQDYSKSRAELTAIIKAADTAHPLANYISETAQSYLFAIEMLDRCGTAQFTELSKALYGTPLTRIGSDSVTLLDAADDFISTTSDYIPATYIDAHDVCILASTVAADLQKAVNEFFVNHPVSVVIDPELTSKAAAGARRVRIRGYTCFSPYDTAQLLHHECFVHTLTLLNGREQPNLKSMGLGAPRTTRAQEGLAVFAELVHSYMDLTRLRRLALRVKAVQLGLNGADFIEIFKFFLNSGQPEFESFQSAARIFRGGNVKGRWVFTKDLTYLQGLIDVNLFLKKSIKEGKLDYPTHLFAGRLDLADVPLLEEFFTSGFIANPLYLPEWIKNRHCLIAFLLYSNFFNRVKSDSLPLQQFLEQRSKNQELGASFSKKVRGYFEQVTQQFRDRHLFKPSGG